MRRLREPLGGNEQMEAKINYVKTLINVHHARYADF